MILSVLESHRTRNKPRHLTSVCSLYSLSFLSYLFVIWRNCWIQAQVQMLFVLLGCPSIHACIHLFTSIVFCVLRLFSSALFKLRYLTNRAALLIVSAPRPPDFKRRHCLTKWAEAKYQDKPLQSCLSKHTGQVRPVILDAGTHWPVLKPAPAPTSDQTNRAGYRQTQHSDGLERYMEYNSPTVLFFPQRFISPHTALKQVFPCV